LSHLAILARLCSEARSSTDSGTFADGYFVACVVSAAAPAATELINVHESPVMVPPQWLVASAVSTLHEMITDTDVSNRTQLLMRRLLDSTPALIVPSTDRSI
jgi:hypothetical protein